LLNLNYNFKHRLRRVSPRHHPSGAPLPP
jgi:hypothetical protein